MAVKKTARKIIVIFVIVIFMMATGGVVILYLAGGGQPSTVDYSSDNVIDSLTGEDTGDLTITGDVEIFTDDQVPQVPQVDAQIQGGLLNNQ